MDANDRAIDHLHVAIVGLGDRIHQPIPHPGFAPTVEAIVGGGVRAIAARQVPPTRRLVGIAMSGIASRREMPAA